MSGWYNNLFGYAGTKKADAPKNAILKLRETKDMLSKRERHLQDQIDEQDAIARKNVNTAPAVAKNALKKKRVLTDSLVSTSKTLGTVDGQISSIEEANINKQTLDAMQGAQKALKGIHNGLTIDKVDQTMEELEEQHAISAEITNALTQNSGANAVDDDELDEELAELQQQELDKNMLDTGSVPVGDRVARLPSVATGEPSGKTSAQQREEDDEEEELKRLQAEMAM